MILAQVNIPDLSQSFTHYVAGDRTSVVQIVVLVLVAIVMVLLVVQITAILRARRKPRLLFYDLALLHNVSRAAQRRLLHLAHAHNVTDPAFLFVCPDLVRRVKSLEMARAATDSQRRRLEEFFTQFEKAVFG